MHPESAQPRRCARLQSPGCGCESMVGTRGFSFLPPAPGSTIPPALGKAARSHTALSDTGQELGFPPRSCNSRGGVGSSGVAVSRELCPRQRCGSPCPDSSQLPCESGQRRHLPLPRPSPSWQRCFKDTNSPKVSGTTHRGLLTATAAAGTLRRTGAGQGRAKAF